MNLTATFAHKLKTHFIQPLLEHLRTIYFEVYECTHLMAVLTGKRESLLGIFDCNWAFFPLQMWNDPDEIWQEPVETQNMPMGHLGPPWCRGGSRPSVYDFVVLTQHTVPVVWSRCSQTSHASFISVHGFWLHEGFKSVTSLYLPATLGLPANLW